MKKPLFKVQVGHKFMGRTVYRTVWVRADNHVEACAIARKHKSVKGLRNVQGTSSAGPYDRKPEGAKAFCTRHGWRLAQNLVANKGYYVRPDDQFNWTPPKVHKRAADAYADGVDMIRDGQKFSGDLKNPAGDLENSGLEPQNSNLKLESWFRRATALLAENDSAWEGEEDSVKEEKAELIESNTKFFKDLEKDNPLTATHESAHKLVRDLSTALGRLMGNMSPPSDRAPGGPYSFKDNWANAKAVIEQAARFEA